MVCVCVPTTGTFDTWQLSGTGTVSAPAGVVPSITVALMTPIGISATADSTAHSFLRILLPPNPCP